MNAGGYVGNGSGANVKIQGNILSGSSVYMIYASEHTDEETGGEDGSGSTVGLSYEGNIDNKPKIKEINNLRGK